VNPIALLATARPLAAAALAFALALAVQPLLGAPAADGDEYTIRPSDIPADAPRAADFPAQPYAGVNAAPDVRSDPRSRMYRTQLREWAREKPNFAGHYILATWGCGTGCTQIAIIDAVTGKVFHPPGVRSNQIDGVDENLLVDTPSSPRRSDFGALHYSVDSRLLVLFGTPEQQPQDRGISYFVWDQDHFTRIRIVRKPGAPATR